MVEGLAEEDVPQATLKIGLLNTYNNNNNNDDDDDSGAAAGGGAEGGRGNGTEEAELGEYMDVYDAVITGDGPLDFVISSVLAQLWDDKHDDGPNDGHGGSPATLTLHQPRPRPRPSL